MESPFSEREITQRTNKVKSEMRRDPERSLLRVPLMPSICAHQQRLNEEFSFIDVAFF